ncbi:hypothetical protein RRG08_043886 [Elysia crispata]|uniref:Helicase/UvrB N-terminal domain-containing protein n=1 Tax=Elysia crispata TaxID=231223 RepID=A0AAE1AYL4_9GAST|nr:hypothetical protein RRG08_043886 [Elysia crispata]
MSRTILSLSRNGLTASRSASSTPTSCFFRRTLFLARDHPDYPHAGAKQYACVEGRRETEMLDFVKTLGDGHLYEVIRADRPARGFLDVDFVLEDDTKHVEVLKNVLKAYTEFTGIEKKCVMTRYVRPENLAKGSFHVVFPDVVFEYAHAGENGQKKLMVAFREWCRTRYPDLFIGDGKFVVDTSVYSRNRVFRLPGNSKKGQNGATLEFMVGMEPAAGDVGGWFVQEPEAASSHSNNSKDLVKVDDILSRWFKHSAAALNDPIDSYQLKTRTVGRKNNQRTKYELVTAWKPVRTENDDVIYIREDDDFLDHLDARELKSVDWEAWFMPVVASLSRSVDRVKLAWWCSTTKVRYMEKYGPLIDVSANREEDMWVRGGMAMRALKLKAQKKGVIDLREGVTSYVNDAVTTIEASAEDGWAAVSSKGMFTKLANELKGDNRPNTQAPRRCFFITGKMGASKTTSVLEYTEHLLRTGKIKSVLYICPRTVLCSQTAKNIEEIHLREVSSTEGRKQLMNFVKVCRFYTNSEADEGSIEDQKLTTIYRSMKKKVEVVTFDCCVVNSINKLPLERYDLIIADEPVVTVSNFYMDYEAHGGSKENSEYNPIDYSFAYSLLIRRAKRAFFVDAAFTQNVMDLCTSMYLGGTRKATQEEVEKQMGDVLPKNTTQRAKAIKDYVVNQLDAGDSSIKRLADIKKYVVYDPTLNRPIFENIVEYEEWHAMLDDLVRSAYADEKSILYCSTSTTAKFITAYLRANPPPSEKEPVAVPKMALVTAETLASDGRQSTIRALEGAQVAIVTSGLGIGSSFPLPDMFAFAFIEYKDRTPHMDDMVQLCARVRATTRRHLSYTVRTGTSKPCSNLVTKSVEKNVFLMPRKDTVDSVPRLLAKAYYDRKDLHRAQSTFRKMAREMTKTALLKGFSHTTECSLNYTPPNYELNLDRPPAGVNSRMYRSRKMLKEIDSQLPDWLVHVSARPPHRLVRGDNEADRFDGVTMSNKAELTKVRFYPTGATPVLSSRKRQHDGDDDNSICKLKSPKICPHNPKIDDNDDNSNDSGCSFDGSEFY